MERLTNQTSKSRLRFSYVLLALALLAYGGAAVYAAVRDYWRDDARQPKLKAIKPVMGALRAHQKTKGSFPETLEGIRPALPKGLPLSDDGRSFISHNYFYFYSRPNPHACTLWVVPPTDESGRDSQTFFLVISPNTRKKFFKDGPLSFDQLKLLKGNPLTVELAALGMTEDPAPEPKVEVR